MKIASCFQIAAALSALTGLALADASSTNTSSSVQVTVSKPIVIIDDKRAPAGPVTWLGVAASEAPSAVRAQLPDTLPGALIVGYVAKDSPAARGGLEVNDVLTRLDDQILVNEDQLKALVAGHKDGDSVKLTAYRHGRPMTFSVRLQTKTLTADEAVYTSRLASVGGDWLSVPSLSPQIQQLIHDALVATGTVSIEAPAITFQGPAKVRASVKAVGADGKVVNLTDPKVVEMIKDSLGNKSGIHVGGSVIVVGPDGKTISSTNFSDTNAAPIDPAMIRKIVQQAVDQASAAATNATNAPSANK